MSLAIVFFGLMLAAVPIGFVLIGASLFFVAQTGNVALIDALPGSIYSALEIFDLLSIPLFILLGEFMSEGGITRRLFAASQVLLGWVPRSLAYVNLVSNLFLAAILGSANAQVAVMSRVCVPEMTRAGYRKDFASALTAAASLLGPIIPPSMIFIIFAVVAQVSIGEMFIGGILPGLALFGAFAILIAFMPSARPDPARAEADPAAGPASTGRSRLLVVAGALPALLVPAIVVGGILTGAVTPTESAGVAVAAAFVIGAVFYRQLPLRDLPAMLLRTAMNSAVVMFLIATARAFGFVLTYYGVPQAVADAMIAFTSDPAVFLLLVLALLLIIGAVMEGMAALIILVPILLPVAQSLYGIHPIHFGMLFCITLVVGLVTPPVGTALYIASAINKIGLGPLSWALAPFIVVSILVLLVITLVPWLSTALL